MWKNNSKNNKFGLIQSAWCLGWRRSANGYFHFRLKYHFGFISPICQIRFLSLDGDFTYYNLNLNFSNIQQVVGKKIFSVPENMQCLPTQLLPGSCSDS